MNDTGVAVCPECGQTVRYSLRRFGPKLVPRFVHHTVRMSKGDAFCHGTNSPVVDQPPPPGAV
jgi:hypothetical protein